MRPGSLRLNVRVFSVFLIVGLLMLVAASYFVMGIGQAGLRDAWGVHLRQVADQTAAAVDTYVFRLVIDTSMLSRVPEVRELAAAGSGHPFDLAATQVVEREWRRPGAAAPAKEVMGNKVSAFLAEMSAQNPVRRELLLTDRYGRLLAASGPSGGYFFGATPWWREAFADGTRGKLVVSDVRFDQRARVWVLEIVAPVQDPTGSTVAGVLRAVVDAREIGAVLAGVRMGATGDAALVRGDGSFVLALGPVDQNARFFATNLLRERLAVLKKGEPQTPLHFGANTANGTQRLVGIATCQLKASFPNLDWVVAVSQGQDELFAPVRAQEVSLVVVLALTAIAVLLFALWYSMRLAAPLEQEETDMHLVQHPSVHRMEEREGADEKIS